jgi:tetratricopeptide (TPR) repeat protein
VTRRAFARPTISDVSLVLLGLTQLAIEFAVATRAILLVPAMRAAQPRLPDKSKEARRARFGRLAVYTSIGFLVLMVRLPVWSTYLELLDNSPILREFILRNDFDRLSRPHNTVQLSKEEKRLLDMRIMLMVASDAIGMNRFKAAEETYLQMITQADSEALDSLPADNRTAIAHAFNGLAWLQATCPETARLNPVQAVRHARRATELEPNDGNIWNTLGVAHYRAGDWHEANSALSRSMNLRNGGDSFDWFFLALVQLKLGHGDLALQWYEKAVAWFHETQPNDRELYRFQLEAARELKLPQPAPPPPSASLKRGPLPTTPVARSGATRLFRARNPGAMLRRD